jgi:flagellar assembly protein FliH
MSLFKIIKPADPDGEKVAAYSFESLQGQATELRAADPMEFRTMFSDPTPRHEAPPESSGEAPVKGEAPDDACASQGPSGDELEVMLRDAFDSGFARGRGETEEYLDTPCRSLAEAVAALDGIRERLIRESEEDLLRLSVMVAKRVIQQELSLDRRILAQFVAEATQAIMDQEEIVICFNPEDCRVVSANKHLYLAGVGDKKQLTIKPDASIPVGGCVVDTPIGLVDARVDSQLAEIFKRLMQERGHAVDALPGLTVENEQFISDQYGADKYGYARN